MIPFSKAKCTGSLCCPFVKGHSAPETDWVGGLCGGPWLPMNWVLTLLLSRWRDRLGAVVVLGCGPSQDHLSRGAAGNPRFPRLLPGTLGNFPGCL